MCRARAAHAKKEMEYWLAEAKEWKQIRELPEPFIQRRVTPDTGYSEPNKNGCGENQMGRMVPVVRQRTTSKVETQVDGEALLYSDDECVQRLAALLEHKDSRNLKAVARLISRLAVPIE